MRYERVDLNLFRVFDAIMSHRSVAGASRELGVTPSAVSHALTRLRKLLDDDLFLPSTDGMLPTPRAIELAPSIRDGLGSIARVLDARPFDPAKIVRAFGIAASHLPATVILPPLLARLLSQAPNASVRVFPMGRRDTVQQLDDGRLDLIIGWFETLPPRMRRQTLMWEQEAMVVRAGHPLTLQKVTRQRLFAFPHVVVEFTGSEDHANDGFIDERGVMRRIWIERLLVEASESGRRLVGRVAATVPDFAAIAPMLAVTDLIATLPARLARRTVERDGLVMLDLPYQPLSVAIEMVWHERSDSNPVVRWLLDQVAIAADQVQAAEASGRATPTLT